MNPFRCLSYRHCFDVLRLGHPLMPLCARSKGSGHHRARCLHRRCLHNRNEEISDAGRQIFLFMLTTKHVVASPSVLSDFHIVG